MGLSIAHRQPYGSSSVVLALEGTLDHNTHGAFYAAVAAEVERVATPGVIVVDITGVVQVDPAGIGGLVGAGRLCAEAGVLLILCGPSPPIRALLRLDSSADRLATATTGEYSSRWCTPTRLVRPGRPLSLLPARSRGPGRNATRRRPGRGR